MLLKNQVESRYQGKRIVSPSSGTTVQMPGIMLDELVYDAVFANAPGHAINVKLTLKLDGNYIHRSALSRTRLVIVRYPAVAVICVPKPISGYGRGRCKANEEH
jgi:hypothetical protein